MEQTNKDFIPGSTIYVVTRDRDCNADGIWDLMFLATVDKYAILSDSIHGTYNFEEMLSTHCKETVFESYSEVSFFPISDCYKTIEEAKVALK